VVVAGEPGIGNTRLRDELASLAKARDIRVLHGRSVEQDRAFAYQGFCELIQDYFRLLQHLARPAGRGQEGKRGRSASSRSGFPISCSS